MTHQFCAANLALVHWLCMPSGFGSVATVLRSYCVFGSVYASLCILCDSHAALRIPHGPSVARLQSPCWLRRSFLLCAYWHAAWISVLHGALPARSTSGCQSHSSGRRHNMNISRRHNNNVGLLPLMWPRPPLPFVCRGPLGAPCSR